MCAAPLAAVASDCCTTGLLYVEWFDRNTLQYCFLRHFVDDEKFGAGLTVAMLMRLSMQGTRDAQDSSEVYKLKKALSTAQEGNSTLTNNVRSFSDTVQELEIEALQVCLLIMLQVYGGGVTLDSLSQTLHPLRSKVCVAMSASYLMPTLSFCEAYDWVTAG